MPVLKQQPRDLELRPLERLLPRDLVQCLSRCDHEMKQGVAICASVGHMPRLLRSRRVPAHKSAGLETLPWRELVARRPRIARAKGILRCGLGVATSPVGGGEGK